MSRLLKRVQFLESAAEERARERISMLDEASARREFHRLAISGDKLGLKRLLKHLALPVLKALASDEGGWISRLPLSDLRALSAGNAMIGPLPPGIG